MKRPSYFSSSTTRYMTPTSTATVVPWLESYEDMIMTGLVCLFALFLFIPDYYYFVWHCVSYRCTARPYTQVLLQLITATTQVYIPFLDLERYFEGYSFSAHGTLRSLKVIGMISHRRDRGISGSGGGEEEATSPMACVTSSDAQAHPAPRDIDDVTASGSERAHDPAPRDIDDIAASGGDRAHDPAPRDNEHTTSGGGGEEALHPAPMSDTTSGGEARDLVSTSGTVPSSTGAEPYRPMTEPVSPYRAPTPVERPELTLSAIHATMVTSVPGGTHQQAILLHESHDTPLSVEVVQLLVHSSLCDTVVPRRPWRCNARWSRSRNLACRRTRSLLSFWPRWTGCWSTTPLGISRHRDWPLDRRTCPARTQWTRRTVNS